MSANLQITDGVGPIDLPAVLACNRYLRASRTMFLWLPNTIDKDFGVRMSRYLSATLLALLDSQPPGPLCCARLSGRSFYHLSSVRGSSAPGHQVSVIDCSDYRGIRRVLQGRSWGRCRHVRTVIDRRRFWEEPPQTTIKVFGKR